MTSPRPRSFVAYIRVSTERQGTSGLGLEAQQEAIRQYLEANGGKLLATFRKIESGKVRERPQLQAALLRCRQTRATLLVAKLDRLSRSAAFLTALQESGARFVAADLPEMNETVVGIMAVIARDERQRISQRTKAALQAAKARGVQLGNAGGAAFKARQSAAQAALAREAASIKAVERATELRDVITDARHQGARTLRAIAEHLNGLGIQTPRGGDWHAASVSRVLKRLSAFRGSG